MSETLTIALAGTLIVAGLAYWARQQRLLNQLRRLQARHRALTEKSER